MRPLAWSWIAILLGLTLSCGGPKSVDDQIADDSAVAGVIDGAGGSLEVVDPGNVLFGSYLGLPNNSLGASVFLLVAPNPDVAPQGFVPVGPAVRVGPAGTAFANYVTITVPFDPRRIPSGRTASDIAVLVTSGFQGGNAPFAPPVAFLAPVTISASPSRATSLTFDTGIFQAVIPPAPPPLITGMTPLQGPMAGGTQVTLNGTGFVRGAQVLFDGIPLDGTQFISSTTLTAVTAPRMASTTQPADVTVQNPDGGRFILFGPYSFIQPAPQ